MNSPNDQQERSETEQWVQRARQGDVDAFSQLVCRYRVQVCRFVQRLTGQSATADEIAQEVFLSAYQSLDRFEGQGEFSGWLMGIAKKKTLS
ncbi:MAG: hypothetical protein MI861_07690, partial [Pirellulales bacterium]|nr:hypothetical protein [Pirellulales bacterium]